MERRFYRMSKSKLSSAVARLAERVVAQGQHVGIYCANEKRAQEIDEVMWRDMEFLPHVLGEYDGVAPIHIAMAGKPEGEVIFAIDDSDIEALDAELICYLFHAIDHDIVAKRREDWKSWRDAGDHLTYWAENDQGGWEKAAEENTPA